MTKYRGSNIDLKIRSSAAAVTSNTSVTYVASFEYNVLQNVQVTPKGFGSRQKETHEKLMDIKGKQLQ